MADLSVKIFGKSLRNPVMNASGTLGYGSEIEPLWSVDTLGAYVSKGLSEQPHHGNPPCGSGRRNRPSSIASVSRTSG